MSRQTPWRTTRRQWALHQQNNDWYRIRNQSNGGPTQLHIYDEIGFFGVSAMDLIHELADVDGPLDVHISSPGGEVDEGITIYNNLIARNEVTVYIDGIAASIASVIAMAGNPVLIARNARMMVHDGFAMAIGNAQDMRDMADQLDKASNNIADIYASHTGKPVSYWREIMKAEKWYDSDEAIEHGLADRLIDNGAGARVRAPETSNQWDMSVYRDAASVPYVGREQHRHIPMTTRHEHDHAAFGADDHDDGVHIHPHSHSNDANHAPSGSHVHTPGMGHEGSEGSFRVMEDNAHDAIFGWDGAAAMAACHSASDYKHVCAGERSEGDPDSAGHWALPHHSGPSSGPDKGGVVAALGRWNQTQGLKNKSAALSHLKAHASALGLPSGDSDNKAGGPDGWSEEDLDRFSRELRGAL
jgi:ATP-dependent protease ClpP protease subunit